ncbi:MAG: M23 family metallopeptidase [Thermodesulfovibrionales bacterium]|nr:M23 family metallopeptidase [Thermodesulfovibrionales bacterium]
MLTIDKYKVKRFLKGLFSPITVMFIPHSSRKPIGVKLPSLGIVLVLVLWISFAYYVFSNYIEKNQYEAMEKKLASYKNEFMEVKSSIDRIKAAEHELIMLISHGNKEKIFNSLKDYDESGTVDINEIKKQIEDSLERIEGLKEYIHEQKNIYLATPKGWPIKGRITSEFGTRESPHHGKMERHQGIDISAPKGTEIYATADGIVSYSGWGKGNGNMIMIEHGMGFRTLYAHNSKNLVNEGQRVKRGDLIALAGATGNATGSHLHYEIWLNDRPINPFKYMSEEVASVSKKE